MQPTAQVVGRKIGKRPSPVRATEQGFFYSHPERNRIPVTNDLYLRSFFLAAGAEGAVARWFWAGWSAVPHLRSSSSRASLVRRLLLGVTPRGPRGYNRKVISNFRNAEKLSQFAGAIGRVLAGLPGVSAAVSREPAFASASLSVR